MVYQGFRLFKRNPTFYNPRSAGMVALAYVAYSYYSQKIQRPFLNNFEDYGETHTHSHEEKVRQYHVKQNELIRDTIAQQREEHSAKLREQARQ